MCACAINNNNLLVCFQFSVRLCDIILQICHNALFLHLRSMWVCLHIQIIMCNCANLYVTCEESVCVCVWVHVYCWHNDFGAGHKLSFAPRHKCEFLRVTWKVHNAFKPANLYMHIQLCTGCGVTVAVMAVPLVGGLRQYVWIILYKDDFDTNSAR